MEEDPTFLESAVTIVTDFAGTYTGQVLSVLGIAVLIGLGVWGFRKLVKLFRAQAG